MILSAAPVYSAFRKDTPGGLSKNTFKDCAGDWMSQGVIPGNVKRPVKPVAIGQQGSHLTGKGRTYLGPTDSGETAAAYKKEQQRKQEWANRDHRQTNEL